MAKQPRAYYRATERACLHCGATLEGRGTPAGGTAHASPSAFVGFVQVRYRVYTCPQCGRQQTRGKRTTWGGKTASIEPGGSAMPNLGFHAPAGMRFVLMPTPHTHMMHIRDMEDATARYSMCGAKVAYLGDFYSEPPPTGYRVCKRCQVKRDRVLQRTPSGVQSS